MKINLNWEKDENKRYRNNRNKRLGGLSCPICKFHAVHLSNHIAHAHKIPIDVYRVMKGLTITHPFITKELSAFFKSHAKEKLNLKPRPEFWIKKGSKHIYFISPELRKIRSELGKKAIKNLELGRARWKK